MAVDKFDLLGPALALIGEEAMRIVGGPPNGIYIYVEIGEGWVEANVFKDEGDRVRYFWPDSPGRSDGVSDLSDAIVDAWCLEPEDKRWTVMHYIIEDGKFDAKFDFDDLERRDETEDERRERVLDARYGDKPRIYPSMRPGAVELKPPS